MILRHFLIALLTLLLVSCATKEISGTISELESVKIELKDIEVEGGLDKAMQAYQQFLEETPEGAMTPEAMRRLADLKVEKEYGLVEEGTVLDEVEQEPPETASKTLSAPGTETTPANAMNVLGDKVMPGILKKEEKSSDQNAPVIADLSESQKDFENRATQSDKITGQQAGFPVSNHPSQPGADLKNKGAEEAIVLYRKLLVKYPMYERNDQVLYQLARAHEEVGQVEEAMVVMNRLIKQFPNSRYNDEVHFRRGEYYFTRKKWLDAEDAYGAALEYGVGSVYYERALYKKGWTFYKQELYEEAIREFFILLDYKVSTGYDFDQTHNKLEKKRIDDTFRVISLGFSNLGGADSIQEFFDKYGTLPYADKVYSHLAEFYFSKRRYNDAAVTYNAFIEKNPFHKVSPHFSMRTIEIYMKGGFPRLVIESKKNFCSTYGINAEYWNYFNQEEYPKVLGYLKTNLVDLANHYHSMYQNPKFRKDRFQNFNEASHWYRQFLDSFPKDEQSPAINYQLADLLLENKDFLQAAIEYEKTAYDYPVNDKSSKAGYSAVYSYREYLKEAPASKVRFIKREIIRSSLRMIDAFPRHEKATVVLGAAVDDLFEMRDYPLAVKVGRRLINEYPKAEKLILRGAWLVVAHSSYELEVFNDAELAYIEVLKMTPETDEGRFKLVDNLAASIYKQGEQAREKEDYREAVRHFLRIAKHAPTSKIRINAEYDAAAVLIHIMDLDKAAEVLLAFRANYPGHELQHDVTKKIAFVYKEAGKYQLAAVEYERIETESEDEDVRRESLSIAAELYEKIKDADNALRVYQKFVGYFPKPVEEALEVHFKIAMVYKSKEDMNNYRGTLQHIITTDANAGAERTDRTRYLAASASLVLIEPDFEAFLAMKLIEPLKQSVARKKTAMKNLVKTYTDLVDYKVADVTAASTFHIAEIYFNFSRSLMQSERPKGLSDLELEEFTLVLEEQAFPFEEKAISVHEKNIELLTVGVYSNWIDKSIGKLAKLMPARYDKPEERLNYIAELNNYIYSSPRYIREDASTGIIANLGVFRYVSQNYHDDHKTNRPKAELAQEEVEKGQKLEPDQGVSENVATENAAVPNSAAQAESPGSVSASGNESASVVEQETTSQTPINDEAAQGVNKAPAEVAQEPTTESVGQAAEVDPAGNTTPGQEALSQDVAGDVVQGTEQQPAVDGNTSTTAGTEMTQDEPVGENDVTAESEQLPAESQKDATADNEVSTDELEYVSDGNVSQQESEIAEGNNSSQSIDQAADSSTVDALDTGEVDTRSEIQAEVPEQVPSSSANKSAESTDNAELPTQTNTEKRNEGDTNSQPDMKKETGADQENQTKIEPVAAPSAGSVSATSSESLQEVDTHSDVSLDVPQAMPDNSQEQTADTQQ